MCSGTRCVGELILLAARYVSRARTKVELFVDEQNFSSSYDDTREHHTNPHKHSGGFQCHLSRNHHRPATGEADSGRTLTDSLDGAITPYGIGK